MIELYRRAARGRRTVNALNKLHIELENRMTPLELDSLRAALPPARLAWLERIERELRRLRRHLVSSRAPAARGLPPREWIERLDAWSRRSGKLQPEPFRRRRLSQQLTLFATPGERATKTLVICFAGRAQRMMMPLPVFLQHFDASQVDIALVRDPRRNGFRSGIPGIADELGAALDGLRTPLEIDAYRATAAIGTSGGGLPAVLAALRLRLDAVLSIGGNSPYDPRWRMATGCGARELLRESAEEPSDLPEIFLTFGADMPKDRSSAEALAGVAPAKLIAIGGPGERVGHGALVPLLERGELAGFFQSTVLRAAALSHRARQRELR